jgi:hypothetical protein
MKSAMTQEQVAQLLGLLAQGLSTREAALHLGVPFNAARYHSRAAVRRGGHVGLAGLMQSMGSTSAPARGRRGLSAETKAELRRRRAAGEKLAVLALEYQRSEGRVCRICGVEAIEARRTA